MTMTNSYSNIHSVLALALQKAQKAVEQLQLEDDFEEGASQRVRIFQGFSRSTRPLVLLDEKSDAAAASVLLLEQQNSPIPSCEPNNIPVAINTVNPELLNSGVAIYLGCCDKFRDAGVVLIYCKHAAWTSQYMTITYLCSLLLYYQHLSRKKLTLIVDAREATREVIRTLLETISELEMRSPGECAVDIVHILVDRISQALILRSPFLRNSSPLHSSQIDLLTNIDVMYRVVDRDHLPIELGGYLLPFHLHWVHFRQMYDSLMVKYLDGATVLIRVAKHLSIPLPVAKTVAEISEFVSQHCDEVDNQLQLPSITFLKSDGLQKLQKLRDYSSYLLYNVDYRESMEIIERLFAHLMKSVSGLSHLASVKFSKLNLYLEVRNFEEHCNQVLIGLDMVNNEIFGKYIAAGSLSESLLGLRLQRNEFNEIQQTTKMELSKGSDLLQLGQRMIDTCDAWGVQVIRRYCIELQQKIDDLTLHLDLAKEKMNVMERCIQLLDKTFEWIRNAAKFVVDAKSPTTEVSAMIDLEKSISDLKNCLLENPLSSSEVIQRQLEDCRRLESKFLTDQCSNVQSRCSEVVQLMQMRQKQLYSQKEKLRRERRLQRQLLMGSVNSINSEVDMTGFLRRRSYAGKPSTPMYSPHVEAFKRKDMDIQEYEEYLFSEGLITDNMSERIVASLPKGLSDMTMRGSRESLRSSKESLQGSHESLVTCSMSCESLPTMASVCQEIKPCQSSTKALAKPWNTFKKTVSFRTDRDNEAPALSSSVPPAFSLSCENLEWSEKRNQSNIMSEIIQTERDYVRALEFVITNYMPELNRDDVVQLLRGKRNMVFGNLEKIYEFHSQLFLRDLELCREMPLNVGATFLSNASSFYLYALYNKNKPNSDALMKECGNAFFVRKQLELGEKLDLSSYLLKPVQRMGRYALLLEELIKECSESDMNYNILKDALEMVRFQLRHGNDLLAMDCIRHCDVSLQEQGRLLLQNSFSVTQGRHKMDRHVFLFEDIILFTKPRRHGSGADWLDYKNSLKTSDIGLTENTNDERKFEIWFRKQTADVTYVLEAPSADVKHLWISCISRLLWKQAIRNRQRRKNELVDMGHDLKPGIDLSQSNNYIHNRAVSPSVMHNKLSRFRNSIAVSSSDLYKTGYKRPQSMISVNSSSSGSSHSSGYSSNLSTTVELPADSNDNKEEAYTQTTLRLSLCHMKSLWLSNINKVEDEHHPTTSSSDQK